LPFLSPKAYSKIHPVTSIFQLQATYGVPLTNIRLPLATLEEESGLRLPVRSSWLSAYSPLRTIASYIPFSNTTTSTSTYSPVPSSTGSGEGYWDTTLDELVEKCGGVPKIFDELRKVILGECVTEEGIFRRTPGVRLPQMLLMELISSLTSDLSSSISLISLSRLSRSCHGGKSQRVTLCYRPRSYQGYLPRRLYRSSGRISMPSSGDVPHSIS
jgi:hypothetical protein